MQKYRLYFSLITLALLTSVTALPAVYAEIYTWTDKDGNTIFTDQPQQGAKKIKLGPLQTWSAKEAAIAIGPQAIITSPKRPRTIPY